MERNCWRCSIIYSLINFVIFSSIFFSITFKDITTHHDLIPTKCTFEEYSYKDYECCFKSHCLCKIVCKYPNCNHLRKHGISSSCCDDDSCCQLDGEDGCEVYGTSVCRMNCGTCKTIKSKIRVEYKNDIFYANKNCKIPRVENCENIFKQIWVYNGTKDCWYDTSNNVVKWELHQYNIPAYVFSIIFFILTLTPCALGILICCRNRVLDHRRKRLFVRLRRQLVSSYESDDSIFDTEEPF